MIIPGFSRYDITTDGVVTFVATGALVKPRIAKVRNSQYKQVLLSDDNGLTRSYNVMALLALTYLGKSLHTGIVRARDGDNLNTVLSNVVCTTQAEIIKQTWQTGKLRDRRRRGRCYSDESIEMVYEAMQAYDAPVTMSELSRSLDVPYATVRYSMAELRAANKVRKTTDGFEVI